VSHLLSRLSAWLQLLLRLLLLLLLGLLRLLQLLLLRLLLLVLRRLIRLLRLLLLWLQLLLLLLLMLAVLILLLLGLLLLLRLARLLPPRGLRSLPCLSLLAVAEGAPRPKRTVSVLEMPAKARVAWSLVPLPMHVVAGDALLAVPPRVERTRPVRGHGPGPVLRSLPSALCACSCRVCHPHHPGP
jgi:hypothetical protein